MKKLISVTAAFSVLALLSGCNTFSGMGEDMQSAGKAINNSARKVQKQMSGSESSGNTTSSDTYQAPSEPYKDTPYYGSDGQPVGSAQQGY